MRGLEFDADPKFDGLHKWGRRIITSFAIVALTMLVHARTSGNVKHEKWVWPHERERGELTGVRIARERAAADVAIAAIQRDAKTSMTTGSAPKQPAGGSASAATFQSGGASAGQTLR